MPQCKKCTKHFKTRVIINEIKTTLSNSRKCCLDCSPYITYNNSQSEKVRAIAEACSKSIIICSLCSRKYIYNRSAGHTLTNCNSCIVLHRKNNIKIKSVEYKGGKCLSCGYNRCINALSFHHVNKAEKKFTIGGNYNRSWKSIQIELDKCILLCTNCHIELHAKEKIMPE